MKRIILSTAVLLAGCAGSTFSGKDEATADFEKETRAADVRIKEDNVRSNLSRIESSLADYFKVEKKIPKKLESLVPKYMAEIPGLDLPPCGRETSAVEIYPADILRGGQVDGTRLRGTGRWGYVFNERQVVVFVDCLKPSSKGIPWYQERGVY